MTQQAVLEKDTTSMYQVGKKHAELQRKYNWPQVPYTAADLTFANKEDPDVAHAEYLKGYNGEPE